MGNYYEVFDPPFFMERRYRFDAIAVNPLAYDRADEDILRDFSLRLGQLGLSDTRDVTYTCLRQHLTLRGTVTSPAARKFLGNVAENILGTRGVENLLEVKRAGAEAFTEKSVRNQDSGRTTETPDSVVDHHLSERPPSHRTDSDALKTRS